ncbi:MAG TPA: prolyl oligopeptidase family serine peptidase [Acidimicrobiia bacterium]
MATASTLTLLVVLAACSSSSSKAAVTSPTTTTPRTAARAVAAAANPSAGCSKPAPAPGQRTVHITSSGVDRWYLRNVPSSYRASVPMPLVVDVHGYEEGASIEAAMTRLGAYGNQNGFITVTPNGLGPVPHWDTTLGSKDLKFIGDTLDDVERTVCVDTNRVYATGLSQGAFMTSSIACQFADRFAAVAPVAGITAVIKGCKPVRPVPVISFHGTADQFVAYNGGLGPAALNLPTPDGKGKLGAVKGIKSASKSPSVPQQLAAWAKRNGCTLTLREHKVTSDVTLLSYPCPKGSEVELYRVTGGGHSWPGSAFSALPVMQKVVGKTTLTINADALIWHFFRQHSL